MTGTSKGAQLVLLAATVLSGSACSSGGPQGNPGAPGRDGVSCTVVTDDHGAKKVTCSDGTTVTITDGRDGESWLVRVEQEPPGANCKNGGVKVLSGKDANADGALEDGEVASTSYVCAPTAPPCTTLEGSVFIRNSNDWKALVESGCTEITGDLDIYAHGLTKLEGQAAVQRIGGELSVTGNSLLTEISSFDALTDVGAIYIAYDLNVASVSFPSLRSIGNQLDIQNIDIAALNLPSLEEVRGFIRINSTTLEELSLPSLEVIDCTLYVTSNPRLTTVSLPSLTSLGGHPQVPNAISDNPVLESVNLPALEIVGFAGGYDAMYDVTISNNPALASVSLPVITSLGGSLKVDSNASVGNISFPSLAVIGLDLKIIGNPHLRTLSGLSALSEIDRDLTITDNAELPECQALALKSRLLASHKLMGSATISSNDTSASCP